MDDSTASQRPRDLLEEMAKGFFRGKVLCAAVQLGLPDAFAQGERSVDELAAATGTHAPSLHRLLRALASFGVTVETAPARFVLTALGQPLRKDVAGTVRATVEFWADSMADRWTYLADCVRSGSMAGAVQAMERDGMKSRIAVNPQAARSLFHGCFAEATGEDHDCFVDAYDFSACRVVADLGGGGGGLLASILWRRRTGCSCWNTCCRARFSRQTRSWRRPSCST
jgi:hypothetical protein